MTANLNILDPNNNGSGIGYTFGNSFTLTTAQELRRVRWFQTGASPKPARVSVWDVTNGVSMFHSPPAVLTWTNPVGSWWEIDLTDLLETLPVLAVGPRYMVTVYGENAGYSQCYRTNSTPVPDDPLVWYGSHYAQADTQNPGNTNQAGTVYGVDVFTDPTGTFIPTGPGGEDPDPPTNANITGRLAEWFSANGDVQTHEADGLPWLAKLVIDSIKVGVDEAVEMLGDIIALGVMIKAGDPAEVAAAVVQIIGDFGIDQDAKRDTQTTAITDAVGTRSDTIDAKLDVIRDEARLGRDTQPIPGSGWGLVDTVAFAGTKAWDVPADRYVYHLTAWGEARQVDYRDGVEMLWHRGWAAPLNGTLVGRHQTINAVSGEIYEVGMRFNGIVYSAPPDIETTLEAWVFNG